MAWSDAARAAALEARRMHAKTPGVALSKAYARRFTGEYSRSRPIPQYALTSAFSRTGKPGGLLTAPGSKARADAHYKIEQRNAAKRQKQDRRK